MIMPREVFGSLLFVGVIFCFFFWPRIVQFYHWLKGSRKSYYFGANQRVVDSSENFRESIRPVIEINRGLFRRRSAIYGSGPRHWQVADVSVGRDGTNWIELQERRGLVVGRALELINTYPSLQAMLDRIAELEKAGAEQKMRITKIEKERDEQRFVRRSLEFGVSALLKKIEADRQRFRSEPSKRIKQCLGELQHLVIAHLNGHQINLPKSEVDWEQEFERYLQYRVVK